MARLECTKCRSIYQDVVRVKKCPLCGNREFFNVERDLMGLVEFPRWFRWQGNLGFVYYKSMRSDGVAL